MGTAPTPLMCCAITLRHGDSVSLPRRYHPADLRIPQASMTLSLADPTSWCVAVCGSRRCMLHVACCMLHVACCMLHVACFMLHVACCMCRAIATLCRISGGQKPQTAAAIERFPQRNRPKIAKLRTRSWPTSTCVSRVRERECVCVLVCACVRVCVRVCKRACVRMRARVRGRSSFFKSSFVVHVCMRIRAHAEFMLATV